MSARGRIVVGTLGLDQHEVGAMAVSQLLMRSGFEVIYVGRFNTPEKLARVAEQEDADIVGVSVHSWELVSYAPDLVDACHAIGVALVVGGSVLTEDDERALSAIGVDATFGPYAPEDAIVARLEELVARVREGSLQVVEGRSAVHTGSVSGRVVVVTGAARGLGRAYVERLLSEGAAVVANDVDARALDERFGENGAVACAPGDVSVPATADSLVRAALDRFGRLDAVIANAGLLRSGPLVRIEPEEFELVQAVHVRGTFLLLRASARYWRAESKAGREVSAAALTTTSSAGLYGFLGEAAYSAAKAGIAAMTLVAADELSRYGVTVNAIAPVARTRLTAWMGEAADEDADPYAAVHVAPVAAWLVSDKARAVTGRVFEVGGGQLSLADGWRPTASAVLPLDVSVADAGELVEGVVAAAPPPRPVLRADAAALAATAD
jgi:methylmalonyl-CoA mutase cobalamin-binding domain/chain